MWMLCLCICVCCCNLLRGRRHFMGQSTTTQGDHIISVTPRIIDEHLKTMSSQRGIEIDVCRLKWKPPLTGPPAKKV